MKTVTRLTLSSVLLAGILTASASPAPSGVAAASKKPGKGSWKAPVLVHSDYAHRETSLAINPKNSNHQFICAPSGVPNTEYGHSYFHVTRDGGKTWKPLEIEGEATDGRNYTFEGGDCDVAFDAGGTMYSADTWLGNLSVGRSTNNGETWEGTPLAATGLVVDRPWLVGGPKGTIHITYQDLQCCMPSAIWYTRSTDFGNTFLPTVPVAQAGPDGAFTWQGNLVVSSNGKDLYLAYTRRQGAALIGSLDEQGAETLWVAKSHDSGLTWKSTLVARMANPMSYLYPSIAIDGKGHLHVVFSSRTKADRPIWYAFSKNRGDKWTKPLPLLRGAAGYSPWVVADRSGRAAIVWYGSTDPKATDSTESPWYFYWARVSGASEGSPKVTAGRTTSTPLFKGKSGIPEFENVRLDSKGRMHIGASAYEIKGIETSWAIYHQTQR
jgi:BNR repeat-like domain